MKALFAVLLVLSVQAVQAGLVSGGSLLSGTDANQLESWTGLADQDFNMIWSGDAGVGTSSSFHAAVDGAGPTFSIYEITLHDDSIVRVGGYTTLDWGGATGYFSDNEAFIFNLDTLEAQFIQHSDHSIYVNADYFSTFGAGHDIYAGISVLGTYYGSVYYGDSHDGSSYSHTYDQSQGQIVIAGDSGIESGDSGVYYDAWHVNSLEVYTFTDAVPEPSTLAFIGIFGGGLSVIRRRFPKA